MAIMGMIMGIGVGFLTNTGHASRAAQSLAILRETAYACIQSSNGGVRAIWNLRTRSRDGSLVIGAAVNAPVLTDNFERLDGASGDYPVRSSTGVEIVPDGYTGQAARFTRNASILFEPQSSFAMTEGLGLSVWLAVDAGGPVMTIAKAEGAWALDLVRNGNDAAYDVRLKMQLEPVSDRPSPGVLEEFSTKGSPIRADGTTWTHLAVTFDGSEVSMRVDGLERYQMARKRPQGTEELASAPVKRITVPESGAAPLSISDGATPFNGRMDEFVLSGVFRAAEMERLVDGVALLRPKAPVRVTYRNGRLDPDVHASDVVLLFQEMGGKVEGSVIELRLGLYGTVEERMVQGPPTGGAP